MRGWYNDAENPSDPGEKEVHGTVKEKKDNGFLRWPWNVVLYALLIIALRLFAIPVILLLVWVQQKNNPNGVAEGYCLSRTRKRLSWLLGGLVSAAVGGALLYMFYVGMGMDRTYWDKQDEVTLWGSIIGGAFLLLLGLYLIYTGGRDTFFPAKSSLADSIRSQLPYPDEAPPVGELFAMVDNDLKENGQWFGPVGIGQEWVLGEQANRIDRIRGIFVVDEIRQHSTQTGTRTSRNMQLVLVDDRWRKHVTDFRNPQDMRAAADCLALRVPDARRGGSGQCSSFMSMDEGAREDFERDFRQKQNLRASEKVRKEALQGGTQDMILKRRGGEVTSRVSNAVVEEQLKRCLDGEESGFELTPTRPIEGEGRAFRSLNCFVRTGAGTEPQVLLLMELVPTGAERDMALMLTTTPRQGGDILRGWRRKEVPDLKNWELRRMVDPSLHNPRSQVQTREMPSDHLALLYASGAAESHDTFTQEDVEVAAEGIIDGTYQKVKLSRPRRSQWMIVEAGDKSDGRCTVRAARADPDKLRFFSTKTTPRQAASWLLSYSTGKFLPGGADWKDYTKEVEKEK